MATFKMNNVEWQVDIVSPTDNVLIDRTGHTRLATTDVTTHEVHLSSELKGDMFIRVLLHELSHCALYSYGLLDDIHRMCYKDSWYEAEEWVCNFIADYCFRIFSIAYKHLGLRALDEIPKALDKIYGQGA